MTEEIRLVRGVNKHGAGCWTKIHADMFTKSSRTPTDLKDKWDILSKRSNKANLRRLCAAASS